VKRFCSIMTQLLQIFPRNEFHQAVKQTNAERHARGFSSWDQFVAMLFCQLADAHSLREIVGGLSSCQGRLEQFGIKIPKRSTLAYANRHRPWELFENVFHRTSQRCRAELGQRTKFRYKNPLRSIDSSVITLALDTFPWARWTRQKGAVKLHFTLDHAGYLPEAMVITTGKFSEMTMAQRQRYEAGTIVVMDRGFMNFRWFSQLHAHGVFFVTRMKDQVAYEVTDTRPVVAGKGIISDQEIRLTSKKSRSRYTDTLRLVIVDAGDGKSLEFLTNNKTLSASTIGAIYKERWQIETFFKLLKQNLRVKTFIGTSANAVWIQIWTALIAMLLLKYLQLKARFGWSFSNLVYYLRMNLLVYRDLWDWLHRPFIPPPEPDLPQQLDFLPELFRTASRGVS
jgi:hypothetical protein